MSALHKEMERERAKYAAARRRREVGNATATELNMDLLTNAIADDLRCQAALDGSPSVRATASLIPRKCATYTFRAHLGPHTQRGSGQSSRLPPVPRRDFRQHVTERPNLHRKAKPWDHNGGCPQCIAGLLTISHRYASLKANMAQPVRRPPCWSGKSQM